MACFFQRASQLTSGLGSGQMFCKEAGPRTLEQQLQEHRSGTTAFIMH